MRTTVALATGMATFLLAVAPLSAKPNGSQVPPGTKSVFSCKSTAASGVGLGKNDAISGWMSAVTQKYGYGWASFTNAKNVVFGTITSPGKPANPSAVPPLPGSLTVIRTTVSAIPCNYVLVFPGSH